MRFKKKYLLYVLLFSFIMLFLIQIPIYKIATFPNNVLFFSNDIDYINENKSFGDYITVAVNKSSVDESLNIENDIYEPTIEFKLFNLIPIKKRKVKMLDSKKIYAGGMAVGLVLNSEGVIVVGCSPITTRDGEYDPEKYSNLLVGDVILSIEGNKIDGTESVSEIINKPELSNKELIIKVLRDGKEVEIKTTPVYDIKSNIYRLGVWVKDDASGIGTLTFIDSNLRFGALGHPICDSDTKSIVNIKDGKIYNCSVMGVNKSIGGVPGEIRGLFLEGKNEQGYIEKNNEFGVFGELNKDSNLIDMAEEYEIGGRFTVKPGKAQIRCCIDGINIKMYDIEIIKTSYQNYSNDKSMVIRVLDQDLLNKTGGIVQGMSGSPIIQNGRLVGAVTHVFINDPTKGFGVYLDWMYGE